MGKIAVVIAIALWATVTGVAVGGFLWVSDRFHDTDREALVGIVSAPLPERIAFANVSVWDGFADRTHPDRTVLVDRGRIEAIVNGNRPIPAGATVIDGRGRTLIPGLIDGHVHLLHDSGPDLLTRGPEMLEEWLDLTSGYPLGRDPIVRRGQLKLKAGVTTMRILGDGYYSLAYRDDVARWIVVGPRVLTAGLHVNGPNGYVSGGLAADLDAERRAQAALELTRFEEIAPRLQEHIARGIDVVKIATTHGDMGFQDARPDLPESWVREIVRVSHAAGLKVVAHSYGDEGDWAAIRGGVDGIEHLVNVPHRLSDSIIAAIKKRGIYVTPTLSGSAYSVLRTLSAPELLYSDRTVIENVPAKTRRDLYLGARLLSVPGVAPLVMREQDPLERLREWRHHTIANTARLHRAGVRLVFGTDTPFAFGNFHHSVMNEVRGLKEAGLSNQAILRMATSEAAGALGLSDRIGSVQVGKVADLVLLEGDPVDDIDAVRRVALVLKEGRVVYRGETR